MLGHRLELAQNGGEVLCLAAVQGRKDIGTVLQAESHAPIAFADDNVPVCLRHRIQLRLGYGLAQRRDNDHDAVTRAAKMGEQAVDPVLVSGAAGSRDDMAQADDGPRVSVGGGAGGVAGIPQPDRNWRLERTGFSGTPSGAGRQGKAMASPDRLGPRGRTRINPTLSVF